MIYQLDLLRIFMFQFLRKQLSLKKTNKFSAIIILIVSSSFITLFLPAETGDAYSVLSKKNDVTQTKQISDSKGSFSEFLQKLAQRETGQTNPPYNIENQLGFIGKYQFGEALLIDLGYYKADSYYGQPGVEKNYWQGQWTGKDGINSKTDFLDNKNNVQDSAIRQAFQLNWDRIQDQLQQKGSSINQYLGESRGGIVVTSSGILAAAHLRGETATVELLTNGKVSHDENGTSILDYLSEFGGYKTPFN